MSNHFKRIEEIRDGLIITDPSKKTRIELMEDRISFKNEMGMIISLLDILPIDKITLLNSLKEIYFSLPHVADPDFSHWKKGRDQAVQFLNNILSHIDEPFNKKQQKHSATSPESNPVFIVYGHNKNMLNEVARYLKKEEVNYIILEDLANKGDTLIEKFERSITENNVNYAIVLFSPDDHLLLPIEDEKHSREIYRVRQNILIELGYFMGKFGRGQTCVIFDKSKVEQNFDMPSDYQGVAWIAYDDNWKDDLRTELKGAHIIK